MGYIRMKIGNCELNKDIVRICSPLTGDTVDKLEKESVKIFSSHPDLAEWRLDAFSGAGDQAMMKEALAAVKENLRDIPLIITYRSFEEGGFSGKASVSFYLGMIQGILSAGGADAVDVEAFSKPEAAAVIIPRIREKGIPVIASNHDFKKTPPKEEIARRLAVMERLGGDILKTAYMIGSESDLEAIRGAAQAFAEERQDTPPLIMIGMGDGGRDTRIRPSEYGSCMTFAAAESASAPGQIPVDELREILGRR